MSDPVITDACQIDIGWLDAVLARGGALRAGGVGDLEIAPLAGTWSRLARLRLTYRPGSLGSLPPRLLLKMVNQDGAFGPSEVDSSARDYADLPNAPIPTCYDAHYSPEQRRYHILMDDHSDTHRNNFETTPTLAYGLAVAEAVATLHAHRWGDDRLRAVHAAIPTEPELDRYLAHVKAGLLPLLESGDEEIDPAWPRVLDRVFARHPPAMLERTRHRDGFTLIHGDLNPDNVLSPITGAGPTYLIDRQPFDWSLTTWLGVGDLSYLMVHWWDPDLRRAFELPVLRRYHDGLVARGVTGYPWERLVADYKLCAVQSLYVAVEWGVVPDDLVTMRWVWLPQLKRSMTAFFDLGCDELWS